jgi:hypothetical protein
VKRSKPITQIRDQAMNDNQEDKRMLHVIEPQKNHSPFAQDLPGAARGSREKFKKMVHAGDAPKIEITVKSDKLVITKPDDQSDHEELVEGKSQQGQDKK